MNPAGVALGLGRRWGAGTWLSWWSLADVARCNDFRRVAHRPTLQAQVRRRLSEVGDRIYTASDLMLRRPGKDQYPHDPRLGLKTPAVYSSVCGDTLPVGAEVSVDGGEPPEGAAKLGVRALLSLGRGGLKVAQVCGLAHRADH